MSDPTKRTPKWQISEVVVNQVGKTAQHKSCRQEELVEILLVKQLSVESINLTAFEKIEWEKKGLKFDVQAICLTQNVRIEGSLVEVFGAAITLSDTFLTQIHGKDTEKGYLFSIFTRLHELLPIDEDSYEKIVALIRKNKRKYNIYKKYVEILEG